MRRFIPVLLALFLLLSLSSLAAQDQPAATSTLQLVDSEPFAGQELGLQSKIKLYFDRPVDCSTAQNAVTLTPAVAGDITCNDADSSVIFTPGQPFQQATT